MMIRILFLQMIKWVIVTFTNTIFIIDMDHAPRSMSDAGEYWEIPKVRKGILYLINEDYEII